MANDTEDRLRRIEDQLEIYNLIASHPPSVDSGAADYQDEAYAEGGVLALPGGDRTRPVLVDYLTTADQQTAIAAGLAHFTGLPYVRVDGDRALGVSYLLVLTQEAGHAPVMVPNHGPSSGHRIHTVTVNRWDLARGPKGWRIERRTSRAANGKAEAQAILQAAVADWLKG